MGWSNPPFFNNRILSDCNFEDVMKGRLRILYVCSEIAPFAKTGGLADVANALPKALTEMGHEVRLMMPKYGCINERRYTLREVIRLKEVPILTGDGRVTAAVKSAFLPDSKVQVYFLDHKPAFDRFELYSDPKTNQDFPDNAERFATFCRGVLETLKILRWEPNIIHCNDWQTSLIPVLLKTEFANDPFYKKMATVLTLHNVAYQGKFDADVMAKTALPESLFAAGGPLEYYGQVNYLKGGCLFADLLTTVSEKYAEEIQSDAEYGGGLEGVFAERKEDLYGILNGVDYNEWNPDTDKLIPYNYNVANFASEKIKNKKVLLEKNKLKFQEKVPIIGMVSRLAEQKGFDLLVEAIDKLMSLNIQMVILGVGDEKYHQALKAAQKKYNKKLAINLRFDNELAHLIEAGSDMFLMPSRFEPCGLNQSYSLKYGTVPIVRATGGLADTIFEYDSGNDTGNGFVFAKYSSSEMLKAVNRAINLYADAKVWQRLVKKGMKEDFSWATSAEQYVKVYSKLDFNRRKK